MRLSLYEDLFKCARCQAHCFDLTLSHFVICAAVMVVASPTFPHKHSIIHISSMARLITWTARSARLRCVFPYSLLRLLYLRHPADRPRTSRQWRA